MQFKEHGVFEVKIEDKLLLVDATGPFNEELVIQYEEALESCIKNLETSKWNQIIKLQQLSLFTPEAEQKLIQTLINRKARGLIACVVVLVNIEGGSLVKTQMSGCYNKAGVKHHFTTSVHDAKAWLSAI